MNTGFYYGFSVVAFAAFAQSVHAEVFKCQVAGNTRYQAKPCPDQSTSQQVLAIDKLSADKTAEAQRRLASWQAEHDRREAVKQAAARERQQELMRQKEVESLHRAAKAQEAMARAAKEPIIIINPQPVYVPFGPGDRHFKHHHKKELLPAKPEAPRRQSFAPKTPTELK